MSCQNIDPFQVACTAASACNYIYRQLFMPENSIEFLPTTVTGASTKHRFQPVYGWNGSNEEKENMVKSKDSRLKFSSQVLSATTKQKKESKDSVHAK